jgi:hypothetical protein
MGSDVWDGTLIIIVGTDLLSQRTMNFVMGLATAAAFILEVGREF